MNLDIYKDKGLSGLGNLGNTCFLNSCMQIISHTYELNDILNVSKYKQYINTKKVDSQILIEWDNLRKMLWNQNCIISPQKFVHTIQQVANHKKQMIFTGYNQNDVAEFFIFIISSFHEALSRQVNITIEGTIMNDKDKVAKMCFEKIKDMYSKDYSEIWKLFYGIHISQITSLDEKTILSNTPEPYLTLSLPIPENNKSPTLKDCFNLYTNDEILDEANGRYNENTKKTESVKKKLTFWSFPTILVIDIKRFNNKNEKNQILVNFPLENLNLSEYVYGYNKDSYVYDLYGVCNHSGGVNGGHYTAFIKNANSKWYYFNDTNVSLIGTEQQIITPSAYCFFYRKHNNKL